VSETDKPKYQRHSSKFQCLDGSKKIPNEYVNDNFCDCKDGSDEPGTPACSGKTKNNTIMFNCANKGYKQKKIFTSRVNDGICDCCDGADEYGDDGVKCPNTCKELGKEIKDKLTKTVSVIKSALLIREGYAKEGKSILDQKKKELVLKEAELAKKEAELNNLKTQKKNLERLEETERKLKEQKEQAAQKLKEENEKKLKEENEQNVQEPPKEEEKF